MDPFHAGGEPPSGATLIEFHFQELFTGERIDLLAGDRVLARFVANTRFQIGLAHIERLELADGDEVTVRIDERGLQATVTVDIDKPIVTVRLMDGQLQIESRSTTPGYV